MFDVRHSNVQFHNDMNVEHQPNDPPECQNDLNYNLFDVQNSNVLPIVRS